MARRIVAHVGQMKSGTTFIQQTLAHNRDDLLGSGVLYPGPKFNQQHACYGLCGNDIYWVHDAERWRHAGDAMLGTIADFEGTVLISSEALSCMDEAGVQRFAEQIGPIDHVVVTVRNMLSTLLSAWQQGVKRGAETSLADFFRRMEDDRSTETGLWRNYAFGNTARRWSQWAAVSLVVVESFPRNEVVNVFLRAAGLESVELDVPELSAQDRNVSLRWEDAEVLRALNAAINRRDRPDADAFRGFILERLLFPAAQDGIGTPIKFPEEHMGSSLAWARDEIDKLPPSTRVFGEVERLASTDRVETAADAPPADLAARVEELLFHWFDRSTTRS